MRREQPDQGNRIQTRQFVAAVARIAQRAGQFLLEYLEEPDPVMDAIQAQIQQGRNRFRNMPFINDLNPRRRQIAPFDMPRRRLHQRRQERRTIKLTRRKLKKKSQCSICFDPIKKNSFIPKLECEHTFHLKCLRQWVAQKTRSSCPVCRAIIQ